MPIFAVGLLFNLFGLRMFRAIVFLLGFSTVAILVFLIIGGMKGSSSSAFVKLIIAILCGVGGGYLALFLQKAAVFLVGFVGGLAGLGLCALSLLESRNKVNIFLSLDGR